VHSLTLVPGEGLGAVQTARGLLLHRVRLADGRVAHYQIIAPTEWNFHPEGALVCGLRGLVTDDGAVLDRSARLAVQALDPCVACTIEIGHA
jgi:Ni,Fe-hydrogenase I large subunit